jgi:hypothetical protein
MEQRPLRLGDILDDYCPRERRVTNHAVVAMIEENVKQTRCTTCDAEHPYKGDAEHPYKGGQAPRRRKKETSSALYKEVLAGKPDAPVAASLHHAVEHPEPAAPIVETEEPFIPEPEPVIEESAPAVQASAIEIEEPEQTFSEVEEGPVHRPLIRATLPRPEGQKDARTPPDFTIRQSGGRGNATGNQFRGGGGGGGGNHRMKARGAGHGGNGHRPHGGPRFAGARSGQGQGQGRGQNGGFRSAQQPRHGGGKKRSR